MKSNNIIGTVCDIGKISQTYTLGTCIPARAGCDEATTCDAYTCNGEGSVNGTVGREGGVGGGRGGIGGSTGRDIDTGLVPTEPKLLGVFAVANIASCNSSGGAMS